MTNPSKEEREAICAWLRKLDPSQLGWNWFGELDEEALEAIAKAIERNEHHKGE